MASTSSRSTSKRVHWPDEPERTPRTPSPSYSHSSGRSSPMPITPPSHPNQYLHPDPRQQARYSPSTSSPYLSASPRSSTRPQPRTPSPLMLPEKDIQIHHLLAASDGHYPTILAWDLSLSPVSIRDRTGLDTRALTQKLSEPATQPPVYHPLSIIHPDYTWRISTEPGTAPYTKRQPYVTVGDVLYGLEKDLHRQVTHAEYSQMAAQRPGMRRRVDDAFSSRCAYNRSQHDQEQERNKGVRRLDYLQGSYNWGGLVKNKHGQVELVTLSGRPRL